MCLFRFLLLFPFITFVLFASPSPPPLTTSPQQGSMASSELAEVDDKAADEAPVATVGGQAGGEGGGGGAGEGPPDEEGNGVPCMDHVSAARSKEAIEAGVPQLRASAGPGGLPRGNSWRNLMVCFDSGCLILNIQYIAGTT